jgi:phenylacetate-CoA ligase
LNQIIQYAQSRIPFYKNLYGHTPIVIKTLQDFEQLPVITKSQVREYSKQSTGAMLINTGGSSGEPMSFYIDKNAWAREWAHMHYIWGLRKYKHTDLMISILGRNLGADMYRYNAVHNEFRFNPYMNAGEHVADIMNVFRKYPIKDIQGYPSSIYNLLRELEPHLDEEERSLISSKLNCCFLSSEYPIPYMVKYLNDVWKLDYISWYGHSEMCVLAYDSQKNGQYTPFVTYGYAENVGGVLCGTSYHNNDMPLIRYSTGDKIESIMNKCGVMDYFRITEGREGDFIEDQFGKMLPLTSLIFGRHHEIFNFADYVQIYQENKGAATLYITLKDIYSLPQSNMQSFFNWSDVKINFKYFLLQQPIRTKRGKLKLKLSSDEVVEAKQ